MPVKRTDLVVGPNGAGKSTFVALTLAPLLSRSVFVNVEEIAKQRWPDNPAEHAYDAAQVAADTRDRLLDLGRSFIAEAVFSHPTKLDLIRTAHGHGHTVVLHVLLVPEDLAVQRVKRRVIAGGHDVPEGKIRERHRRLWGLVATAMSLADNATVYDNAQRKGPRVVAQTSGGVLVGSATWPQWTPRVLRDHWPG